MMSTTMLSTLSTLPPVPPSPPPLLLPPTVHYLNTTQSSSLNRHHLSPPPSPTLSTSSVFRNPPPKFYYHHSHPHPHNVSSTSHQHFKSNHNSTINLNHYLSVNNSTTSTNSTVCFHRLCVRQNGQASSGVEICYNDKGDMVKHGEQYIPLGIDTCTQCTCMNGKAEMCISVLCSPPENCRKYHEVTNKCCEFLCLDGDMSTGPRFFNKTILTKGETKTFNSSISTSNLGLRLIASTITSFLILALLLFMIHRLRQRRLLLMIRRLQTRRLEQINGTGPGAGLPPGGTPGINDFAFRFGYFGIGGNGRGGHGGPGGGGAAGGGPLGFGYGMEPPPPYTFWKPPEQFIAPGEAPPSYEETINPNGPPVQLPVCFPPGPPGVEVPPGINPQVQHLNHFNGFVQAGGHEHPSYASFPFPNINNPTHHQGGAPGHVPQIQPHPGRVISLTNSSIANLASCLQSAVAAANNQQVPQQPQSQSVNPQANLNNPQPNPTPNLHLNRLAGPLEHQQPEEMSVGQQQTYTKGHHFLQPPNSSTLVRHNSMPMNRSPQNGGRLYHHPTFHHQGSGMSPYQQQQYPTLTNASQTNNLAYPQRLITHLASSLNDHNQAYITSPVLTPTGPVAHQPPIIDTISSDPNYEHITVVRIGNGTTAGTVSSGPGSLGSYSSSQEGRSSRGSRIYGNGRLIGGVNNSNNKTSFGGSVMRDDGISPYDSYNPRLHPRPLSAVNTPGLFEPIDSQQHPGSSTFNRTMIQTSGDGITDVLSPRTCRTLPVDARPQSAYIPRAKSNSLRNNNSNNNLQNPRGSSSTTARIETNNPSSSSSSSSSPSCHISNPISPTLSTSSLSSLLTSSTSSSSIVNNHNHHHRSSTSEVSTPTSVSPKTSSVISSKSSSPSSSTSSSSSSSNVSSSNASQSTVIRRESPKSRGATTDEDMDEDDDNTLIEDDHQTILSTYSRNSFNALRHIQKATSNSNSNNNKKESTMTISRL